MKIEGGIELTTAFRILIVDDDPGNIHVLEKALSDTYEIMSVTNGFDAINFVAQLQPDLILLDVMMPEISGYDVCRIIKENEQNADLPILFLTALDTTEAEKLGLNVGGIDFLLKPVNLDILKLRVGNYLELKRRNDVIREQRDQLKATLARIKQLEGVIPICSYCHKIRDDSLSWHQLETYISEHSEAVFSHGICPHCYEEAKKEISSYNNDTKLIP